VQVTVQAVRERQHVRQLPVAIGAVQQFGPTGFRGAPVPARMSDGSIWKRPLGSGVTSLTVLGAPGFSRWK